MHQKGRLGDMKAFTFWLLLGVICVIVIGATIGGAVGGTAAVQNNNAQKTVTVRSVTSGTYAFIYREGPNADFIISAASVSSPLTLTTVSQSSSVSSASSAASSAAIAMTDCPSSNGSTYQSVFASFYGTPAAEAGLTFIMQCSTETAATNIAQAYFTNFNDCIELCASMNYWNQDRNCAGVSFHLEMDPPGNCWAHNGSLSQSSKTGVDSATLK